MYIFLEWNKHWQEDKIQLVLDISPAPAEGELMKLQMVWGSEILLEVRSGSGSGAAGIILDPQCPALNTSVTEATSQYVLPHMEERLLHNSFYLLLIESRCLRRFLENNKHLLQLNP